MKDRNELKWEKKKKIKDCRRFTTFNGLHTVFFYFLLLFRGVCNCNRSNTENKQPEQRWREVGMTGQERISARRRCRVVATVKKQKCWSDNSNWVPSATNQHAAINATAALVQFLFYHVADDTEFYSARHSTSERRVDGTNESDHQIDR